MREFGQSTDCPEVEFSICFSREEWLLLNPHKKVYADGRSYIQFNEIWTQIFNLKIWSALHLPCKWKCSHHSFRSSKNVVPFTFDAVCTDRTIKEKPCGNYMYGKCYKIPENFDGVEIKIFTRHTNTEEKQVPHTKKRKIAGTARQQEKKNAKNVKAAYHQVMQANDLMENSDPIPAHLPNLPTL